MKRVGRLRRLTDLTGLAGMAGFAAVLISLTLQGGGRLFPEGWTLVADPQKWLMFACACVVAESGLLLLPAGHPLQTGNRNLAPKLSRGGRNAFRLIVASLLVFWVGSNVLLVAVAIRAIEMAQLKPVSARMHLRDF